MRIRNSRLYPRSWLLPRLRLRLRECPTWAIPRLQQCRGRRRPTAQGREGVSAPARVGASAKVPVQVLGKVAAEASEEEYFVWVEACWRPAPSLRPTRS